jgi:hypothetical protein
MLDITWVSEWGRARAVDENDCTKGMNTCYNQYITMLLLLVHWQHANGRVLSITNHESVSLMNRRPLTGEGGLTQACQWFEGLLVDGPPALQFYSIIQLSVFCSSIWHLLLQLTHLGQNMNKEPPKKIGGEHTLVLWVSICSPI